MVGAMRTLLNDMGVDDGDILTQEFAGCGEAILVTFVRQGRKIAAKGKLGFRLPLLRECLVREFPVSHDEAPRRVKFPEGHVPPVHDLPGFYPSVEPRHARPETLGPDAP